LLGICPTSSAFALGLPGAGVNQLSGARAIVEALQDSEVHTALEQFALALGQDDVAPGMWITTNHGARKLSNTLP
jgi:hypothetical protein